MLFLPCYYSGLHRMDAPHRTPALPYLPLLTLLYPLALDRHRSRNRHVVSFRLAVLTRQPISQRHVVLHTRLTPYRNTRFISSTRNDWPLHRRRASRQKRAFLVCWANELPGRKMYVCTVKYTVFVNPARFISDQPRDVTRHRLHRRPEPMTRSTTSSW